MNTIEKTKKYDLFSHGDEQRELKPGHVLRLKKSMRLYGFLESKPISVYLATDGRMIVIEGHHRLEAAKSLGIPVVYMVVKESEKNSMMAQNELVLKWNFNNFCKAWSAKGREDYSRLLAYSETIPIQLAASMLWGQGAGSGNVVTAIKDGTFRVKTTEVVDILMALISRIGESNEIVKSRSFIMVFSKCMMVDGFSPEQLAVRIEASPTFLQKTSTAEAMLDQVEELYNFKSKVKIPLAHLAREASAARNAKRTVIP